MVGVNGQELHNNSRTPRPNTCGGQDHTHSLSGDPRLYESQHWPLSRSPPSKLSTAWKRPVQISTRSPSESSIVRLVGNTCGG